MVTKNYRRNQETDRSVGAKLRIPARNVGEPKLGARDQIAGVRNVNRSLITIALSFACSVKGLAGGFTNGSFEVNTGDITGVMTASGWTVSNGPPVRFLNDQGATDGAFAALFNPGSDQSGAVLAQTFDTISGQSYQVTFDWGNHGSDATQRLKIEVRDETSGHQLIRPGSGKAATAAGGGGVIVEQDTNFLVISDSSGNSGATVFAPAPNVEFSEFTFTFRAQSASTTLSFTDQGTGDLPSSDGILDNVRVIPIPPPAVSVRVSQLELCWETEPTNWYQLQYESTLTANQWVPFFTNWVVGDGNRFCTNDTLLRDSVQRFYRVAMTNSPP
jgi:hypothetical protein